MLTRFSSDFPPSFYANYRVNRLTPEQIDDLLANGWFRNDLNVYSTTAKYVNRVWKPCIMLRIPLDNFSWKKRLRKMMRRNEPVFTYRIEPFVPSPEKETLWQYFKNNVHQWGFVPALEKHLLKDRLADDFQTWELKVYHKDKLAAFSVFDKGRKSIASLEAAYDPNFAKYSLGLYTMLLEIEYGIREGLSYYYPGFFPKDTPMFEYKLRPGSTEFYRVCENEWAPWQDLQPEDWVLETVLSKLHVLKDMLTKSGFSCGVGYGNFTNRPSNRSKPTNFNVFLILGMPVEGSEIQFFLSWHPFEKRYKLFKGRFVSNFFQGEMNTADKWVLVHAVLDYKFLGAFQTASELFTSLNSHY